MSSNDSNYFQNDYFHKLESEPKWAEKSLNELKFQLNFYQWLISV